MKKGLRISIIIVGSILGLLILISVLAGPIAKKYVEKHSMQLCHREATVGNIRANLFSGTVVIKDLKVPEEDNKTPFLSFDKLKVNMSLSQLLAKKVKISQIDLVGLDAKVIQNGKKFNFSDIIDLYTKDKKKEEKKEKSQWQVDLRNIQIENGNLVYEDAQVGSYFGLNNLTLGVPRLFFDDNNSDIGLDFDFEQGGKIALKLLYDMGRGNYDMKVDLSKFQIDAVKPYLAKSLNIDQLQGLLTGKLSLKGSLQHILNIMATGNLNLQDVKVTHADKSPLLSVNDLKLDIDKIDLEHKDFQINGINLKGFDFSYDNFAEGNTFSKLFNKKEKTKESSKSDNQKKSSPIQYLVKKVSITNGRVVYNDHTLGAKMSYPVSQINIGAENVASGKAVPLSLNAVLGKAGTLACSGNVDVMDLSNAKLKVDIKNLDISDFSPYAVHFLAYPIEHGILSFESENVIVNNMLNSQNCLDIYKPVFGNKNKNVEPKVNIPMKAAMYLITDRKGHVAIDLPVSGDISSPKFSFKKVIWKTFTNLLVKIMASPVDFIANIAGENTFKAMQLPADNSMKLQMENCDQLNSITSVLKEKEAANLVVRVGSNVSGTDTTVVAAQNVEFEQKSFSLIKNYLVSQGVSDSRIVLDAEKKPKANADKVKIDFSLSVAE